MRFFHRPNPGIFWPHWALIVRIDSILFSYTLGLLSGVNSTPSGGWVDWGESESGWAHVSSDSG